MGFSSSDIKDLCIVLQNICELLEALKAYNLGTFT